MKVEVLNAIKNCEKYIVARVDQGHLWYYGSWDDEDKAYEVAVELDGVVVERD